MPFNYEWYVKKQLTRIDSPNGRKYQTPEGNHYESVTTFLGRNDRDKFKGWEDSVGIEEANRVRTRAASRGSLLHNLVESYVLGSPVDFGKNILIKDLFNQFKKLVDKLSTIHAIEYPLYSDVLKLAGTVDCVGVYNGKLSVVDFKTSNSRKDIGDIENYFLQCTIYSLMIEELYLIKIPQIVIIIAVEGEEPQEFISDRKIWFPVLAKRLKER
jgi:genome maintenance exonuclease 1